MARYLVTFTSSVEVDAGSEADASLYAWESASDELFVDSIKLLAGDEEDE